RLPDRGGDAGGRQLAGPVAAADGLRIRVDSRCRRTAKPRAELRRLCPGADADRTRWRRAAPGNRPGRARKRPGDLPGIPAPPLCRRMDDRATSRAEVAFERHLLAGIPPW